MNAKIIQAQRELVQAYYCKIVMTRPDIETIIQWLEGDLRTIAMDSFLLDVQNIINGPSVECECGCSKDLIIHGLEEGSECWKAEYDNCRSILQELLGTIKYNPSKERKNKAIKTAESFLSNYQHEGL